MKIRLLISIMLSTFFISLNAQPRTEKASLNKGAIVKMHKRTNFYKFVFADESGTCFVRKKSTFPYQHIEKYFLYRFNSDMEEIAYRELDFKLDRRKHKYVDIVKTKDYLLLFTACKNKVNDEQIINLYCHKLDLESLEILGESKIIGKIASFITDISNTFYVSDSWLSDAYTMILSQDKTKIFLQYIEDCYEDEYTRVQTMYDQDMNEIWKNEFESVYDPLKEIAYGPHYVHKDGSLSYLTNHIHTDSEVRYHKEYINYFNHVSACGKRNEKLKIDNPFPEISLSYKNIILEGKELILMGEISGRGRLKGLNFAKIDINKMSVTESKFTEYPFDMQYAHVPEKKIKKYRRRFNNDRSHNFLYYRMVDSRKLEDGNYLILAEYSLKYRTKEECQYYDYEIIVKKINQQGKVLWYTVIPKKQSTKKGRGIYNSYNYILKDDKVFLFYNDVKKNGTYKKGDRLKTFKGKRNFVTVLCEIKSDGTYTKETLTTKREFKVGISPVQTIQLDNKTLMLLGRKKKKIRMGKMSIL